MKDKIVLILISILIFSIENSMGQTFPGGVMPFDERQDVEKKLPKQKMEYPHDAKFKDDDSYKVAINITVKDVVLTNIWCFFKDNKLISMLYEFKSVDRGKVIESLKKKYKTIPCLDERTTDCFKGTNMNVEVASNYMIYRAIVESDF